MKYLKPLEFFMEMRKPCMAKGAVIGVTYTDRHLCLAIGLNPETFARPSRFYPKTVCAVEELLKFQNKMSCLYRKFKLVGLVVGKNHVGAPTNLIDDLSKTEKFESLKYTYWVDNITSRNTEARYKPHEMVKRIPLKVKNEIMDGHSALRMLFGYMDVCNTLLERPKKDFDFNIILQKNDEEDDDEMEGKHGFEPMVFRINQCSTLSIP